MGLRVTRYGPLCTMVVVGRLPGTFEPARVMVTMAQPNNASARTNTITPSQAAGRPAGRNRKGTSQSSASPMTTASAHASGGRTIAWAVSVVASMTINFARRFTQALFAARLRRRLLQRKIGERPAVDTVGIPGDIGVAHLQRALGGVPRHPAVLQAVEDQEPGAFARGRAGEVVAQIALGDGRELAVAGVGQPDA